MNLHYLDSLVHFSGVHWHTEPLPPLTNINTSKENIMGSFVEFIAGAKLKLIIGAIILAIVSWGVYEWNSKNKTIAEQHDTIVVDGVLKGAATDTLEKGKAADEIKESVNADVGEKKATFSGKVEKIKDEAEAKVTAIDHQFESLPETPENIYAKNEQTSKVYIGEIWDVYCTAANDAACPAKTAGS